MPSPTDATGAMASSLRLPPVDGEKGSPPSCAPSPDVLRALGNRRASAPVCRLDGVLEGPLRLGRVPRAPTMRDRVRRRAR